MKGLLLKDFYVIIKQLKLFLIVIPVMALAGGMSMSALAVLLGAVLPMTAIAYDERSKWDIIAVMMPYTKRDLVISKYFLGYICMLVAGLLVVLGQRKGQISQNLDVLLFSFLSGLVFIAVNTPILFKYGSEKGRYIFIIAMALMGASGPILKNIDPDILLNISGISPVLLLSAGLVVNYVSMMISIKIKLNE